MKIAITGHRPNKLGNDYDLTGPLIAAIKRELTKILGELHLKEGGDITLITGMALGIDTLWAEMAIENNIPFIAAIPDQSQPNKWPPKTQRKYYSLLSKAQEVVNVSGKKEFGFMNMQRRNEWMVNNCDILIVVWDGSTGGTANCFNYAKRVERNYIRLDPNALGI